MMFTDIISVQAPTRERETKDKNLGGFKRSWL